MNHKTFFFKMFKYTIFSNSLNLSNKLYEKKIPIQLIKIKCNFYMVILYYKKEKGINF